MNAQLIIKPGDRVSFRPGARSTSDMTGKVLRWRKDPRGGAHGWLDIECDDGKERSVRPNGAAKL